ncbi:hypothetical protein ABZ016_35325 [Streptomyces sp. NPDC006372]|uniref:hypothetical protein n=1 Tax=Streptomyces sp. NPDC006372 TaxID=3155599 RepID=UPI0033B0C39F
MTHVEPSHLVELALGNAAPGAELADALRHIEQCDRCRADLRGMTRVVTAARAAKPVDLSAAPPERVWQRIIRDLSRETAPPRPPAGALGPGRRKLFALLAVAAIAAAAAGALHWSRHESTEAGTGLLGRTHKPRAMSASERARPWA